MPQIDLPPGQYHSDRPKVISRREAGWLLVLNVGLVGMIWWASAGNHSWWAPVVMLVPGIPMGALITRLWPMFFLEDES